MKKTILTLAAIVLASGAAVAAPNRHFDRHDGRGISNYERAAIARSAANVATIKARAWRDGKVSMFERFQINNAQKRHAALVARLRRS
jgi:hypothetical protein